MIGYLLDEHVTPIIHSRLTRVLPELRLFVVGLGDAPPKGTLDPALLNWTAQNDCMLVTNNRASMPDHLRDHLTQGKHLPGIIQFRTYANRRKP